MSIINIKTIAKAKDKGTTVTKGGVVYNQVDTAAMADVAKNLTQNSSDWQKIDDKDKAVLAAALRAMASALEENGSKYLRKDMADIARELITFEKGLTIGPEGASGGIDGSGNADLESVTARTSLVVGDYAAASTGGRVWVDVGGASYAEVDYLTVRRAAMFREITIKELKHIGGELALTPAAEKCSYVEYITAGGIVTTDLGEASSFRCYFEKSDTDGNAITNDFIVGDQVYCQKFDFQNAGNGYVSTKYYWRLVKGVGTTEDYHYIDLSNAPGEYDAGTGLAGVPAAKDNLVQLGCRNANYPNRQCAIILSAVSADAPSTKYYQGIDSFSLSGLVKDEGYDSATGHFHVNVYGNFFVGDKGANPASYVKYDPVHRELTISGVVKMQRGSTIGGDSFEEVLQNLNNEYDELSGLLDNVSEMADDAMTAATAAGNAAGLAQDAADTANEALVNLSTGNENLIVNGGFTGVYESESVESNLTVNSGTAIFSDPWGYWDVHEGCTDISALASATGKACRMSGGRLEQTISRGIKQGKDYTFSLLATSTGNVTVSIGGVQNSLALVSGQRASVTFTAASTASTLRITGSGEITEIALIQGNIQLTDWTPSLKDNNKYLSYYKNMAYLLEALDRGSTTVAGGLVLTNQIRVGNYVDRVMQQETGGMNGSTPSSNAPFLWGGGNMDQAIFTIERYRDNPNYEPTQSELANLMAKFVVTHGGRAILNDIILRGYIHAEGGVFKSVQSKNGNWSLDDQGNMTCQDATIKGNQYTPMFRLTAENFSSVTSDISQGKKIDLTKTGLNIIVDSLPSGVYQHIYLPQEGGEWNGAKLHLINNCPRTAAIGFLVSPVVEWKQDPDTGDVYKEQIPNPVAVYLGGSATFIAVVRDNGVDLEWYLMSLTKGLEYVHPQT